MEMYKRLEVIGDGSYGRVWKAEKDGKFYAVKCFYLQYKKKNIPGPVNLKEVDFAARCDHPAILAPVEVVLGNPFVTPLKCNSDRKYDSIFLVSELRESSAHQFIRSKEIKTAHLKRILYQLLTGIEYLHAHNAIYRDVKGANILIYFDEEHPGLINALWCDLGMCKPLTAEYLNSIHVSTSAYKAPELLLSEGHYDKPLDIWALGVFMFELFNEEYPFAGTKDNTVIKAIFKVRGAPSAELFGRLCGGDQEHMSLTFFKNAKKVPIEDMFHDSHCMRTFDGQDDEDSVPNFGTKQQYAELLEKMLDLDPLKRPTISEVLNDPFFEDIPEEDPHDNWFGLRRYEPTTVVYHVLEIIIDTELRDVGIKVLKGMSLNFHKLAKRIAFLALDLYDRCLLAAEDINGEDVENIACACCHLSAKYFRDEDVPELKELLPKQKIDVATLVEWEHRILKDYVDFKIYRVTAYDLLSNKSKSLVLLKTLMDKPRVYGWPVNTIAGLFEETSEDL